VGFRPSSAAIDWTIFEFWCGRGGLEPPCPCERSHLKAVRLPISPLPLVVNYSFDETSSNTYLKLMPLQIANDPVGGRRFGIALIWAVSVRRLD
jgi:hypothetical protein